MNDTINNDKEIDEFGDLNFEEVVTEDSSQQQQQQEVVEGSSSETKKQQEQTQQPSGGVDVNAIAAAVQAGVEKANASKTTKQPEEEELTDEQLDEYLKRVKVSREELQSLGLVSDDDSDEVAVKKTQVMHSLISKAVQEAVATNQVMMQNMQHQLNQQYSPVMQAFRAQQEQQVVQTFYQNYPDLQPYEKLVQLATAELKQSGELENKTIQEIFPTVAAKAAEYVKKFGGKEINISATQKSQGQQSQQTQVQSNGVPKPAESTTGGRSQQQGGQSSATKGAGEFDFYD